jgi:hypothetical protein
MSPILEQMSPIAYEEEDLGSLDNLPVPPLRRENFFLEEYLRD